MHAFTTSGNRGIQPRMRLFSIALSATLFIATPVLADDPTGPMPVGNPGEWASSADYPASALREEIEGVARFTLKVDANGSPTDCEITGTSGSQALDDTTCRLLLARAQFAPAKGGDGKAVAGTWSSAVRWEIPSGPSSAPSPRDFAISFVVEKDGRVSDCQVTSSKMNDPSVVIQGAGPCVEFASRRFAPPVDEDGNPVRRRITLHSIVTNETIPD